MEAPGGCDPAINSAPLERTFLLPEERLSSLQLSLFRNFTKLELTQTKITTKKRANVSIKAKSFAKARDNAHVSSMKEHASGKPAESIHEKGDCYDTQQL